jgi:hypothetical protein
MARQQTTEEVLQLEREKQAIATESKKELIVYEQTGIDLKTALGLFDCEMDSTGAEHFEDFHRQVVAHYNLTNNQEWILLNAHVGRKGKDWVKQWKRDNVDGTAAECIEALVSAHTPINDGITAKDEFRTLKQGTMSLIDLQQSLNRIKARIPAEEMFPLTEERDIIFSAINTQTSRTLSLALISNGKRNTVTIQEIFRMAIEIEADLARNNKNAPAVDHKVDVLQALAANHAAQVNLLQTKIKTLERVPDARKHYNCYICNKPDHFCRVRPA